MGAVIAAAAMAADRRLVEQLQHRRAVSPESAQPVEARPGLERRRLAGLVRRGIVLEAGNGRFFLDQAAWAEYQAGMRRMLVWVLVLAAVILAAVFLFGRR